jgi:formylmethanofuran dehydrogenase subunit E
MSTTITTASKRCVKCNKDLAGHRRMKDTKGQYWCYDCGSADEARKASEGRSTMVQPCQKCTRPTHVRELVRVKGGNYLCESCAGVAKASDKPVNEGDDLARKEKQKLYFAVAFLVLGGLLIGGYSLGYI